MRSLSDTMQRLATLQQRSSEAAAASPRLEPITDFGSNPGALKAYCYVPARGLKEPGALVVVLHGCGQSAAGYDLGSGWSRLAEERGFAVLFPEQTTANNSHRCFNWFVREHSRRGSGEALFIREMIAYMLERHALDPRQVFITGLSAGGAMAAVMLATYPDVFAGGAIIAGLPYGTAETIPQAFDRMRGHGFPDATELATLVRSATTYEGPWPTLSIWHGTSDYTVVPASAEAIVSQWSVLQGLSGTPTYTQDVSGHERRVWLDDKGREVIEHYLIKGMGHGTPLDTVAPTYEVASSFMIHAGISSTRHIATFWKIAPMARIRNTESESSPARPPGVTNRMKGLSVPHPVPDIAGRTSAAHSIAFTIRAALRKAGLAS